MFESNFTTSKGPCQLIHIATGMLSMLSMLSVTRDVWHVCFCQGWDHETEPWRKCHRSQRFQRVGRSRLPFGVQQDACLRGCVDGLKGGKGGVFFVRFAGARHGIWNVYSQIPQRCKRKVVRVLGVAFFVHRLACLRSWWRHYTAWTSMTIRCQSLGCGVWLSDSASHFRQLQALVWQLSKLSHLWCGLWSPQNLGGQSIRFKFIALNHV